MSTFKEDKKLNELLNQINTTLSTTDAAQEDVFSMYQFLIDIFYDRTKSKPRTASEIKNSRKFLDERLDSEEENLASDISRNLKSAIDIATKEPELIPGVYQTLRTGYEKFNKMAADNFFAQKEFKIHKEEKPPVDKNVVDGAIGYIKDIAGGVKLKAGAADAMKEKEKRRLIQTYRDMITELNEKQEELSAKVRGGVSDWYEQKELDEDRKRLNDIKKQIGDIQKNIERMELGVVEKPVNHDVKEHKDERDHKEQKEDRNQEELAALRAQLAAKDQELASRNRENEDLRRQLSSRGSEIAAMRTELNALRSQMASEHKEESAREQALREQTEHLKAEVTRLENEGDLRRAEIDRLRAEMDGHDRHAADDLKGNQETINQLRRQIETLQRSVVEKDGERLRALQEQERKFQQDLRAAGDRSQSAFTDRIRDLERQLEAVQGRERAARQETEGVRRELATRENAITDLKRQVENAERRIRELETTVRDHDAGADAETRRLTQQLDERTRELTAARLEVVSARTKLDQEKARATALERQLKERDEPLRDMAKLREELNTTKLQLTRETARADEAEANVRRVFDAQAVLVRSEVESALNRERERMARDLDALRGLRERVPALEREKADALAAKRIAEERLAGSEARIRDEVERRLRAQYDAEIARLMQENLRLQDRLEARAAVAAPQVGAGAGGAGVRAGAGVVAGAKVGAGAKVAAPAEAVVPPPAKAEAPAVPAKEAAAPAKAAAPPPQPIPPGPGRHGYGRNR